MITSLKNPWIKQLRKLHQGKYRRSQGQFLLEGTHLIQAAIATAYPLQAACVTLEWQQRYPALWTQLQQCSDRQELVSPEVLKGLATTATPDGVVAIADRLSPAAWSHQTPSLGIALENLQDPGNLGTVIRTAAAVGSDGLWLSANSVDPYHPKVLRASAGQWFHVPQQVTDNLLVQITMWQDQGCRVLATASEGSVPYWGIDLTGPTVLLLGNEGNGLSRAALAAASQVISIPMAKAVESLNVGVAAAVILFEALRQRQGTREQVLS